MKQQQEIINANDFEVWRDVIGYEGDYLVSDKGRVWSFKRKRFLKSSNNGKGYRIVILYKQGKAKCVSIHRLVAQAFVVNNRPEEATEVDHKNHDRSDNRASNLRWVTPLENRMHRANITKIAAYNPQTGERVGI